MTKFFIGKKGKYGVITPSGKYIEFGDRKYQHYHDRIGYYSHLDHWDKKRRANYLARAKGIKANGRLTWNDPESPNYYSINYLW